MGCCIKEKPIPPYEQLRLGCWKKWVKYRRIPWKFIFHAMLLGLTTMHILLVTAEDTPYLRASINSFHRYYCNGCDEWDGSSQETIYTIEDLQNSVKTAVINHYSIRNDSVDHYWYKDGAKTPESGVHLNLKLYRTNPAKGENSVDTTGSINEQYLLTPEDPLGPFEDGPQLRFRLNRLISFNMIFHVQSIDIGSQVAVCYEWIIRSNYDFTVRGGTISHKLDFENTLCKSASDSLITQVGGSIPLILLNVGIFFCGIVSVALSLKALGRNWKLYFLAKSRVNARDLRLKGRVITWDRLTLKQKMKFFKKWVLLAMFGDACNIVAAVLNLGSQVGFINQSGPAPDTGKIITGLGCLLAWINMIRYLEHHKRYYAFISTLKKGLPRVIRFLVGVVPVFIGYAICGVVIFRNSDRFSSVDEAFVTLFAILNGDELRATFINLDSYSPILSKIYLYSFLCVFMYVVLNIFISIIEGAFFTSKMMEQAEAQRDHDHDDPRAARTVDDFGGHVGEMNNKRNLDEQLMNIILQDERRASLISGQVHPLNPDHGVDKTPLLNEQERLPNSGMRAPNNSVVEEAAGVGNVDVDTSMLPDEDTDEIRNEEVLEEQELMALVRQNSTNFLTQLERDVRSVLAVDAQSLPSVGSMTYAGPIIRMARARTDADKLKSTATANAVHAAAHAAANNRRISALNDLGVNVTMVDDDDDSIDANLTPRTPGSRKRSDSRPSLPLIADDSWDDV